MQHTLQNKLLYLEKENKRIRKENSALHAENKLLKKQLENLLHQRLEGIQ